MMPWEVRDYVITVDAFRFGFAAVTTDTATYAFPSRGDMWITESDFALLTIELEQGKRVAMAAAEEEGNR